MQASIQSRLAGAMREQGMRSLLLADPENFGYVAGPMLPYVKQTPDRAVLALFEPGTDEAACTCWLYPDLAQPAEAQLAKEPSAVCVAVAEDAVGADCLIRRLKESRPDLDGVVGVDFSQTAASVFDALRAAFPGCSFKDAGPMLRGLRLVKLPEEIDRIEMACRQVDTGIIGAIILPTFLKCIGVRNPVQMGLSIGTASHAVGTSRAIELGETEGAISGLAIGVAGLLTALIVSIGSAILL